MAYPSNQPDPDSRTDKTSPAPPVTYAEQLSCQAGRPAALLGILIAFAFYFTLTPWISLAITAVSHYVTAPDVPFTDFQSYAASYQIPTGLAANGIAIAGLLLCCWLLMTRLHRAPLGQLSSVEQRLRRGYLGICLGIATILILGGSLLVGYLQSQPFQFAPLPQWWSFLVVVAIVTPWQAAAEEYLFRGYLLQSMTRLTANPWIGAAASSLVFASLHGVQNAALFVDRLAFGLLASTLVILTGGLEAGIAAHIINNVGAYSIAAMTSSIAQLRATQAISWTDALTNITIFAAFATAATLVIRLHRLPTRMDNADAS